jgi:DNA invertase Pin-like site-specific DNA recombinase
MKLVAYLRVSTDRQAEEGTGLDVQERAIRRWAKAEGHRIVEWARDEGVSGSNGLDTRRGLLDALTAIEDGRAAGLVVYRLDRLARNLTVQEGTLAKLWGLDATVYSVDIGEVPKDDPDDPMRTAVRQMVGVFAQLERGMIAARMRSGRRSARTGGHYAGDGAPPYGWRSVDDPDAKGRKMLVEDTDEQKVIERVVALRRDGLSLRDIADVLALEGHEPRRGRWHPTTVGRIIERSTT